MDPKLFKLMRQAAGYTQRDLASELGVSHVLISHLENGNRRITENVEKRFREVVGVTVEGEISAGLLLANKTKEAAK